MKKPVLLLVDDDRAVLDALEAELGPAFEEICRVEAFDDPRAVLEALLGWAAEQRQIAVAIVDQRMPGMTGVELLVKLRAGDVTSEHVSTAESHATRRVNAIMLTGYAGLDSAIAAKNEAGVDRYLEKPWTSAALCLVVRQELADWLARAENRQFYVFREATTRSELLAILRTRHAVYSQTPGMSHLLPAQATGGHDGGPYDMFAQHFGLHSNARENSQVVGSLRVTGDEPSPAASVLRLLGEEFPVLGRLFAAPRGHPLPMLGYTIDAAAVHILRTQLLAAGERVVEPGRFALEPLHRSSSAGGDRHLARFMIEGAIANSLLRQIENALVECDVLHVALYRPYGFREPAGTKFQLTPLFERPRGVLHGRIEWLPTSALERCESMAKRIARTGAACRCQSFPACMPEPISATSPYETGDFTASDVFCPLLAGQRLASAQDPPE